MKKISIEEIKSKTYGRISVIREVKPTIYTYRKTRNVRCKCSCGKIFNASLSSVRSGHTKSCGCLQKEKTSESSKTHGMRGKSEYTIWFDMKRRCNDKRLKAYKNYGARGIKVSKDWLNFENFYRDMGDRPSRNHSLERKDNNKGYCKENCRWATPKQQSNNTRVNINISHNGNNLTLKQWSERLGIKYTTLYNRYKSGWEISKLLTK